MNESNWLSEGIFLASEILLLLSYLPKKMLWLRTIALTGDVGFVFATLMVGLASPGMMLTFTFSILSILVNAFYIYKLSLMSFPCKIPHELKSIYNKLFADFTPKEFMFIILLGKFFVKCNEKLIAEEEKTPLLLLINGSVEVYAKGNLVTTLVGGEFLGEISYLIHGASISEVVAKGEVSYYAFNQSIIEKKLSAYPETFIKLQKSLITSVAKKLKLQNVK